MLPDNLPHLADLKRSAVVADEIGGDYDDPETLEENRACWVQPAGKNEIIRFQRKDEVVTHTVYFLGNPGVKPGDLVFPKDGRMACPWNGQLLRVKASDETTAGTGLLWGVICELIDRD